MKLVLDTEELNPSVEKRMRGAILGFVVGDALGVPVEFQPRSSLEKNPVIDMRSGGTHGQEAGTWSDDSSQTFILMESLNEDYNLKTVTRGLVRWLDEGYWTPRGEAFDVGATTVQAIKRMREDCPPEECGQTGEGSNGNGSLMRTLPIVFYTMGLEDLARTRIVYECSSITHGHPRTLMACRWYVEFGLALLRGRSRTEAFALANRYFLNRFKGTPGFDQEISHFERILDASVLQLQSEEVLSTGYVIPTLESALWCLENSSSYSECVLKAVNLGDDTDTIGAIAGGLAGLLYGVENIPEQWINNLARLDDIQDLITRFAATVQTVKA